MKTAYAQGVPMGADLPAPTAGAPSFAVWAVALLTAETSSATYARRSGVGSMLGPGFESPRLHSDGKMERR